MTSGHFYRYPDSRSELLVKAGFIKKDKEIRDKYLFNKEKEIYEPKEGEKLSGSDAEEEVTEVLIDHHEKTGYPPPLKSYRVMLEKHDLSLEEPYFWVHDFLKSQFPIIEKLEDSFAAAENSAFFGVTQQKLGAQQDKISQFLATVGKMIKELFQMVRELRILDERLKYYEESANELEKDTYKRSKSAEITLKGIFIDLIQGGGKSAASVYGMAQQLEFVTLPDLFFDAPPFKNHEELDRHIKTLEENFNANLTRVLIRHLRQFLEWKNRTHKEHSNRKEFMLKYLSQHYDIIQMYIQWVKPYLRNVNRLTLKEKNMDTSDIISAFEGSMLDIEILARKNHAKGKKGLHGCVLVTFNYRTRAELKVHQEYQRGPVHVGRVEINYRTYVWSDEQLKAYRRLKELESLELMSNISSSIKESMKGLGDELERYIREAKGEEKQEEKKQETKPKKSLAESLLGEFYRPPQKKKTVEKPSAKELRQIKEALEKAYPSAKGHASAMCWLAYHNFKKSHRMVAW